MSVPSDSAPAPAHQGSSNASATLPIGTRPPVPSATPGNAFQTQPVARRFGDELLDVGDDLGHFVLTDTLGEGGMGTVYRAEHKLLGREVAIKVLLPEYARNREALVRFFREAQAVNMIQHPNIVDVTDFVEQAWSAPFIVMELLDGSSLDNVVATRGRLSPAEAIDVALQVCDAMEAVHEHGIVHRDLKPANIMVLASDDDALRVKLLDFGVAKFLGDAGQVLQTATGMPMGTPEFMAPEQIRGAKTDHRADVYALGGILFYLLTGRSVFSDTGVGETLRRQVNELPSRPSELLSGDDAVSLPPSLDELVVACLAKDPEHRVQSMVQLARLLRQIRDNDDVGAVTKEIAAPVTRSVVARWIGIGALGLALVAGAALGLTQGWLGTSDGAGVAPALRSNVAAAPAVMATQRAAVRRVRLESMPTGAAVIRQSDGVILGRTPIMIEAPSQGTSEKYLFRMTGYGTAITRVDHRTRGEVSVGLNVAPTPSARSKGVSPKAAAKAPSAASRRPAARSPKGVGGQRKTRTVRKRSKRRRSRRRRSLDHDGVLDPFK